MEGAIVRLGTSPSELHSTPCGNPVTKEAAGQSMETVDFVCDPPMTAKAVVLDIPGVKVTTLQVCEVTVEHAVSGPCVDDHP